MKNKLLIIAMVAVIGLSTLTCEIGEMYESHAFYIALYGYDWINKPDKDDSVGGLGTLKIEAKKVSWKSEDTTASWTADLVSLKKNDLGSHESKIKITSVTGSNPHGFTNNATVPFNFFYWGMPKIEIGSNPRPDEYWVVLKVGGYERYYYRAGVVPSTRTPALGE